MKRNLISRRARVAIMNGPTIADLDAWRLLRTLARGADGIRIIARNKGLLGKPLDMGEVELTIRPGMNGCIVVWKDERYEGSDVIEATNNLRHRIKCLAKLIQPKGYAA
jgi:hypothetical protein